MRTFKVSDQMYEQMKSFIVDPFDDTPEVVIGRLIEIVNKARDRWSPFEPADSAPPTIPSAMPPAEPVAKAPVEPAAKPPVEPAAKPPRRREQEVHMGAEEESVVVL